MAKLYFKYGAMGSSKTAQVLITKFNYEERGMRVFLIKPEIDTRDGADVIRSRIGLSATAVCIPKDANLFEVYKKEKKSRGSFFFFVVFFYFFVNFVVEILLFLYYNKISLYFSDARACEAEPNITEKEAGYEDNSIFIRSDAPRPSAPVGGSGLL